MVSSINPRELRNAFGKFLTGVTIVTTLESNGTPRGFTANSFSSVSLDPPLLLVCIDKSAASLPVFQKARGFAINILAETQKNVSGLFATRRQDKFEITSWFKSNAGMPLIDQALAWFECIPENFIDAGDHTVLIGRITDFGYRNAQPLGYVAGGYFTLGLEQLLVDVVSKETAIIIGAVLEMDNSILLKEDNITGKLLVPSIGYDDIPPSLTELTTQLNSDQLSVSIDYLFAVYEDKNSGKYFIHYRDTASGNAALGYQFFKFDDIPWDRLIDYPTEPMLRRYLKERSHGDFAVYMGDDNQGELRATKRKTNN